MTRRLPPLLRSESRFFSLLLLLGVAAPLHFSCSAPPAKAPQQSTEPEHIQTAATVVSPEESLDVVELLARGNASLQHERFESAQRDFQLVVESARLSENRLLGLFGWATALDLMGQPEQALRVYSRFVEESAPGPKREEGELRMVRLLVYLERYDEAGKIAFRLNPASRNVSGQVALYGARALSLLSRGDASGASQSITRGRSVIERESLDRVAVVSSDVAALFFALGELRALRAAEIGFDPLPTDFAVALETRCQLILDAQSAYSSAMRANNAHWSSMSGVRVGELYHSLHEDLMAMPRPKAADTTRKQQLFDGALRLRYSILLRKSVSMMRATVAMLERTDERSRWREKAIEGLERIELAEKEEEAAIDALPYSRSQLQQVLDELAERGKAQNGPGS